MFALIFIVAFENLAVTTVMPVIAQELHGADLYALAFGGPAQTSGFAATITLAAVVALAAIGAGVRASAVVEPQPIP